LARGVALRPRPHAPGNSHGWGFPCPGPRICRDAGARTGSPPPGPAKPADSASITWETAETPNHLTPAWRHAPSPAPPTSHRSFPAPAPALAICSSSNRSRPRTGFSSTNRAHRPNRGRCARFKKSAQAEPRPLCAFQKKPTGRTESVVRVLPKPRPAQTSCPPEVRRSLRHLHANQSSQRQQTQQYPVFTPAMVAEPSASGKAVPLAPVF
jgi:hypothetical protein